MMFQFGMGRGPRPMFGGRFGNQGDTNVDDTLGPSFSMPGSATSPDTSYSPMTAVASTGNQIQGASNGDPYAANPAPSPFSSSLSAADAIPDGGSSYTPMRAVASAGNQIQGSAAPQARPQRQPRFSFGGNGGSMRFGGGGNPMGHGGMDGQGGWGGGGQQPMMNFGRGGGMQRPTMGGGQGGWGGGMQRPTMGGGGMGQQGNYGQGGWGGQQNHMQFGGGGQQPESMLRFGGRPQVY